VQHADVQLLTILERVDPKPVGAEQLPALAVVLTAYRDRSSSLSEGVIAAWEGLRITNTELIEGYKANARRHALKGLTARVEDSGTRWIADVRGADLNDIGYAAMLAAWTAR
jgi:hypothetical protein